MKKIDLPQRTISQLISIFSTYPEIEKVIVFGSRVLGNAKPGSDVDCAFSGKNLTSLLVSRIQNYLEEETLLPYFFDCIHLESTQNKDLLEHIKTHGINLYMSDSENHQRPVKSKNMATAKL
jgi:predicted nucleotidyltransferase